MDKPNKPGCYYPDCLNCCCDDSGDQCRAKEIEEGTHQVPLLEIILGGLTIAVILLYALCALFLKPL